MYILTVCRLQSQYHLCKTNSCCTPTLPPFVWIGDNIFHIKYRKQKVNSLLVQRKRNFLKSFINYISHFNVSVVQMKQIVFYHFKSYARAFQYKVLNSILYNNTRLCEQGLKQKICLFLRGLTVNLGPSPLTAFLFKVI